MVRFVMWLLQLLIGFLVIVAGIVIAIVKNVQNQNRQKKESEMQQQVIPEPEKRGNRPQDRNFWGTAALAVGVIFVILSGCIFATTTWKLMPDAVKVISVFAFSGSFFAASWGAERKLHIRKTAMACDLLGAVFLFLIVVAAGYFGMLGPVFQRDGDCWWCVLGMGSMAAAAAMAIGVRRFENPAYTWIFKIIIAVNSILLLNRIGWCILEMLFGRLSGGAWTADFCFFSLAVIIFGSGFASWKYKNIYAEVIVSLAAAELLHFGTFYSEAALETQLFFCALAMAFCFFLYRIPGMKRKERIWNSIGEGIYTAVFFADTFLLAIVSSFSGDDFMANLKMLAVMGMLGMVMGEWGKQLVIIRAAIPVVMWYSVIPAASLCEQVLPWNLEIEMICFCYALALLIWDIVKKDVWAVGILIIGGWMLMAEESTSGVLGWTAAWGLLIGSCGCQLVWRKQERKAAAAIALLIIWCLCTEGLASTLVLEISCLGAFLLAQKNKNDAWTRAYGWVMLFTALYRTRHLWSAVAWWVYLLIAGIGLIIFAAVKEKKD